MFIRNRAAYEAAGLGRFALWRAVRETRKKGYSVIVETITTGVVGLGVRLPDSLRVHAALSLGTTTTRFTPQRRIEFSSLLLDALKGIKTGRVRKPG